MPRSFPHAPPSHQPAHFGHGGSASTEPEFTGPEWYAAYAEPHAADGAEGRLVSQYSFDASWDSWEVHPHGAELVIVTAGSLTLERSAKSTASASSAPLRESPPRLRASA